MIAELPTREVACANCNTTHSNAALCDDCAALVALPCPWDGVEGCDCKSCLVASRACGALALVGSDLNVYALSEVRSARAEIASVDVSASLPWDGGYQPSAASMALYASDALEHEPREGCGCDGCVAHAMEMDARADDAVAFVVDVEGRVTDLATGELLGVVAPVAACAEVA